MINDTPGNEAWAGGRFHPFNGCADGPPNLLRPPAYKTCPQSKTQATTARAKSKNKGLPIPCWAPAQPALVTIQKLADLGIPNRFKLLAHPALGPPAYQGRSKKPGLRRKNAALWLSKPTVPRTKVWRGPGLRTANRRIFVRRPIQDDRRTAF